MLQILLTKYWVLVHLLVTTSTLCFANASVPVTLWCATSLFLFMFALPPVITGEGFLLARTRVATAFRKDVFVYASLMAVLFVAVQCLNGPRALAYDSEVRRWIFSAPPLPLFPSAVVPGAGIPLLVGLLGGLTCAAVLRAALLRHQRLLVLLGLCVIVALYALIKQFAGAVGYAEQLLWFMMVCVGLGITTESYLEGHWKQMGVALVATLFNLFALQTASQPILSLVALLLVAVWICFVPFLVRASGRFPRILWLLILILPILFTAGLAFAYSSETAGWRAVLEPEVLGERLMVFWDQWVFRCGLALDVFNNEPMLGAGPQGFEEMARFYVKGRLQWALWRADFVGVPCEFMRTLAECGMVGTLLLLLPGGILLGGWMMRWVEVVQDTRHQYSYRYIFVLIGSVIGVLGVLLGALMGTPLHHPGLLCVWFVVCASLVGWMPRRR